MTIAIGVLLALGFDALFDMWPAAGVMFCLIRVCDKWVLGVLFGIGMVGVSLVARPIVEKPSSSMTLPPGMSKGGTIWRASEDLELSSRLYGWYDLYLDEKSEILLDWYQKRCVDERLRPSHTDLPHMTSLVTPERLVFRWVRDCHQPVPRCYSVSFRRLSCRDGRTFWLGLRLEDRNGSFTNIDRLEKAIDVAWQTERLMVDCVSARRLFEPSVRRFRVQSIPVSLEEAVRVVQDQLSCADRAALLGKRWKEQFDISVSKGIVRDIEIDFDIDGACNPLSHVTRKADGAQMPESWVAVFILKGALARIQGDAFEVETELNHMGLMPK